MTVTGTVLVKVDVPSVKALKNILLILSVTRLKSPVLPGFLETKLTYKTLNC